MSANTAAGRAVSEADRAGQSHVLENLARVGLLAYGVVHVLIAWLALQLAWGDGGQEADQSGALGTLARQPFGRPLLWIITLGFFALAVWQAAEVLRLRGRLKAQGKQRAKAVQKVVETVAMAIVYLAFGILALRFALGSGQSAVQQQQQTTTGVFSWPGGRVLVGIVALVVIAVGVRQIAKGITRSFLEQIDLADAPPRARRLITRLGQVGFPAKGVALVLAGGLFGYAAITFDPAKASGLDGAMRTLVNAPFGQVLLTLVAVGFLAFGAFLFARARYPERS
jgi:uncharacterized protein YhhL (DUF1145 family)